MQSYLTVIVRHTSKFSFAVLACRSLFLCFCCSSWAVYYESASLTILELLQGSPWLNHHLSVRIDKNEIVFSCGQKNKSKWNLRSLFYFKILQLVWSTLAPLLTYGPIKMQKYWLIMSSKWPTRLAIIIGIDRVPKW